MSKKISKFYFRTRTNIDGGSIREQQNASRLKLEMEKLLCETVCLCNASEL